MRGKLPIVLLLIVSLMATGAARALAEWRREAIEPELMATATDTRTSTLGQLDSFALALLLGGLRGPLVMALWTSSEEQKATRELDDFGTRIELIRLLQPQFDSVHLYQVWNKAYNVSVEMANLASRYTVILDAIDYANRVIAARPNNIDLETQLGEIYTNKLGGAQERDYFTARIYQETQADEPVVRVTFPAGREEEFRQAVLKAGLSPRRLLVRRSDEPNRMVAAVRQSEADQLQSSFTGADVVYEPMAARQIGARGVGGPLRLEPLLTEEGQLLPELVEPTRPVPSDAEPGTYLDGSRLQFLKRFEPYPEGVSPHALAYNHFMKAYVLQNYAGQRHVQNSAEYVNANPGRALRNWAIATFEEGRMLEAEAFGLNPTSPGESGQLQAELERLSADVPLDAEPVSPELLRQAIQRYERSVQVGEAARQWLEDHLRENPGAISTFGSAIDRLQDLDVLLRADVLYDRMLLGEVPNTEAARQQAIELYRQAAREMLDYVIQYHTPNEVLVTLPGDVTPLSKLEQPLEVKQQILQMLRRLRDRDPIGFEHTERLYEFDGYFERIGQRLAQLQQP